MARRILSATLAAVVTFVFTGCGTIFHKERINRPPSDKLDVLVVVLDCCGFLFGIIPGVVALVLDASNHTLYYSASEVSFVDQLYQQISQYLFHTSRYRCMEGSYYRLR